MSGQMEHCRLCNTLSSTFFTSEERSYLKCPNCKGVFVGAHFLPEDDTEIDRYTTHNTDVNDPRYQKFVSPITNAIETHFNKGHRGLDFGSGTGPVITAVLRAQQYSVETYDPYFDNRPEVLSDTYDYIACCEVVEHFHQPMMEFKQLKSLLKPNGKLFIMTDSYSDEIDFAKWYYKNDPTHVFFYQRQTFEWIKNYFDFKDVLNQGRLTSLSL